MIKQNIVLSGRGVVATGAAVALIDSAGSMCAFGDVGQAYNNLPLAVTNLEGTDDMASADQFGWILPYSMTKNGEHSRTAAVRALRECINFAVEERELQPLALWETAWPAHPNKGPYTQHELFVVWWCAVAKRDAKISLIVHGDRQYTWIPTKSMADPRDDRKGCVSFRQRAQSEFCKFVVECFGHRPAQNYSDTGNEAAAGVAGAASASEAQQGHAEGSSLDRSHGNGADDVDAATAAAGSGGDSSCEDEELDASVHNEGDAEQED